jgi:hypothetical protein
MGLSEQPRDEKGQFASTGGLGAWADKRSKQEMPGMVMAGISDRLDAILPKRGGGDSVQGRTAGDEKEQVLEDKDDVLQDLSAVFGPRQNKDLRDFISSSAKTMTSRAEGRPQVKAKLDKLLP